MTTEKLIVELEAKLGNSKKSIDDFEKSIDDVEKSAKNADLSLVSLAGAAKNVALAASGAVTAFTAFVTITAKSRKELQLLADQTGLAAGDFEALAFATETYGVTAEQVADISKDLADKIGEFATVGTGAFQDVADVLGLTEEQALSFAQSLQGLTSQEVIQEISNQLESVNATAEQSTFVFESLGNDLSKLSPLFAENGKELATLTDRYNQANSALAITAEQEKDLAALADTSKLLTDQLGNAATLISASFAPIFNDFFNSVIEIVPQATNTLVDFVNTFLEAEDIQSIDQLNRQIAQQEENLSKLNAQLAATREQKTSFLGIELDNTIAVEQYNKRIEEETERLSELQAQQQALIDQRAQLSEVETRQGGDFNTGSVSSIIPQQTSEDNENQLALIEERFKSEEQLLQEKLLREQEIVGENFDLQVELYEEYLESLDALDQKRLSNVQKEQDAEAKATKKSNDEKLNTQLAYADAALNIGNLLFEDNKALRAGLAVADTAAGITRAFADLPYPAAIAASASIAATGAAQLAAINSASKGGGGTISASTATSVDTSIPDPTPELSVSAGDVSGSNVSVVRVEFDDSTDLGSFLKQAIRTSEINGTA